MPYTQRYIQYVPYSHRTFRTTAPYGYERSVCSKWLRMDSFGTVRRSEYTSDYESYKGCLEHGRKCRGRERPPQCHVLNFYCHRTFWTKRQRYDLEGPIHIGPTSKVKKIKMCKYLWFNGSVELRMFLTAPRGSIGIRLEPCGCQRCSDSYNGCLKVDLCHGRKTRAAVQVRRSRYAFISVRM